jgi:hypothetical protein
LDTVAHNSEVTKQLMTLKELTKETGALHEAQVKQLQFWSISIIENARTFPEIKFSHQFKEIDFNFKKLKINKSKELESKFNYFVSLVQWLLGDDYIIRLKNDKGVIYRGLRKQSFSAAPVTRKQKYEPKLFDGDLE